MLNDLRFRLRALFRRNVMEAELELTQHEDSTTQKSVWLAVVAIALTTACAGAAFAHAVVPNPVSPAPVHKAIFKDGATSTGWIDFEFYQGYFIFFPAKINGHDTMAGLVVGATSGIDKDFAASVGAQPKGGSATPATGSGNTPVSIGGLEVQVGDLTLRDIDARVKDYAPFAANIDHAYSFFLGDDVLKEV